MPFDYRFTQNITDFGRRLASGFVGQPFVQYRLNLNSNNSVLDDVNILNRDIRAKITPTGSKAIIENDQLHSNVFEFLLASEDVAIGDIMVQNDPVYGGDSNYAIASKRPLKKVLAVRCERYCQIFRPNSNRQSGYSGTVRTAEGKFVLVSGKFEVHSAIDVAAYVPCGLQYIGQLKGQKAPKLPEDVQSNYWYVYIPALPGLERLREGDIIEEVILTDEPVVRYRIIGPYRSPAGLQGTFNLVERVTP